MKVALPLNGCAVYIEDPVPVVVLNDVFQILYSL